jgi:hypothetical protein
MPVVRDIPLALDAERVLRQSRFRRCAESRPEIRSRILDLLALVQESHLLNPVASYRIYALTEMRCDRVILECGAVIHGSMLRSLKSRPERIALAICTIGSELEKRVRDFSRQGEPLRALLLDGIGNAAVQLLAREVCNLITIEAFSLGYQVSSPIRPGMPGIPISEQKQVSELVSGSEIGIEMTSTATMLPRKSVSMFLGLGLEMRLLTQAQICAGCDLRESCAERTLASDAEA